MYPDDYIGQRGESAPSPARAVGYPEPRPAYELRVVITEDHLLAIERACVRHKTNRAGAVARIIELADAAGWL